MNRNRNKKGFTLVEIMIVVLIIGILMAIAVPNFIKARQNSQDRTCIANLRQVESAKEQWAMETGATATGTPTQTALVGDATTGFIKVWPVCPTAGTYTIGNMSTRPTCSIGGGHALP
jgi:prepilin-type N-terminal cleavage/methylation domain-containing protein